MSVIVIKLIDKNDPQGAAVAKGQLIGAGFKIVYEDDADGIGIDATKHSNGEGKYGPGFVIVGKK